MKQIVFFFFILTNFLSSAQYIDEDAPQGGQFIQHKNGVRIYVKKPVIVCDNSCYYIDRTSDKAMKEPISNIEGFSKRSDIRWMTNQDFRTIGINPVRGYFWSAVFIYPTGLGGFILSDLMKRRRIQRMYIETNENYFPSQPKNKR
jgi:hypothetical protein